MPVRAKNIVLNDAKTELAFADIGQKLNLRPQGLQVTLMHCKQTSTDCNMNSGNWPIVWLTVTPEFVVLNMR